MEDRPTLEEVVEFLCGCAPLEETWVGDRHKSRRGAFWWRSLLRAAMERRPTGSPAPRAVAWMWDKWVATAMPPLDKGYWLLNVCSHEPPSPDPANKIKNLRPLYASPPPQPPPAGKEKL